MWLLECYKLFPEITEEHIGQKLNLAKVESEVRQASTGNVLGAKVLEIIETSSGWPYPNWWPRLGREMKEPIRLPEDLRSLPAKREAVEVLHNSLKHIEVVSVVLRFFCPEEFGILSPPVMNLVNLPPAENHVELYLRYVLLLDTLRHDYDEVLKNAADVDMALWSAAHLYSSDHAALRDEILSDTHFQEIRLGNLLEGFGKHWGRTDRDRLILARVLLDHDHLLAAPILARCFESIILKMAEAWNINPGIRKIGQAEFSALVDKLSNCHRELGAIGISPQKLKDWRQCRNDAVHAVKPPVAKALVKELSGGVQRLYAAFD